MAGDQIGARTGQLDAAATNFMQRAEACKTALLSVNSAAEALRSDWWGTGNESFEAVMARFHRAGQNLIQELEEISRNVNASSGAFTQLDQDLQRAWNGFGG